jgi:hypothetical protein
MMDNKNEKTGPEKIKKDKDKKDSFEDYCHSPKYEKEFLEKEYENSIKFGKDVYETFLVQTLLYKLKNLDDTKEIYQCLRHYLLLNHQMFELKNITNDDYKRNLALLEAFWDIDENCGNSVNLDPEDNPTTTAKKLKLLDEDEKKFDKIFRTQYSGLDASSKIYFMAFASLIFIFNGYQAPPRSDAKKAILDSMGVTDLFKEKYSNM